MLTDSQYIIESFRKNFETFKNKNIVLYGEGPYTKLIVDFYSNYNIVGIMHQDLSCSEIYGKKVIPLEHYQELQADIIIVVCKPESITDVIEHIKASCLPKYIHLYSFSGENLYNKLHYKQDTSSIVHSFKNNFENCKTKKIVLYGSGQKLDMLIEHLFEFNIVGIMDKDENEGQRYGKKYLTYYDVLNFNVDMIIVVADECAVPLIYRRISEFCSYNHILLYDANGKNLFESLGKLLYEIEDDKYFYISEEQLMQEILQHEVISFDIFDTLVMRKVLQPIDVFELVEDRATKRGISITGFKALRIKAQSETKTPNANIFEIYITLQKICAIADDIRDKLLQLEIEIEKQVLIQRKKVVQIMRKALELNKKVYLISDMYLPGKIIEEMLNDLGIGGFSKIFVSCDYRISKWEGLYETFRKEVKASSYLHIGDHKVGDGFCAKKQGLDSFCIKKAMDMLDISSYAIIQSYLTNINERSLIGLFIAKAFNNPFALYKTKGRLKVDEASDLGYLFVAPLLTTYMFWLLKELRRANYEGILFCARDGFLIQKLYNIVKNELNIHEIPEGTYLYISREVALKSSVQNDRDIWWLCILPYKDRIDKVLLEKFELPHNALPPYTSEKYQNTVEYGLAHKDVIFKKSEEMCKNYCEYIKKLGLKPGKKYAFFDLVASGTSQKCLTKIYPIELKGLYLCQYDTPEKINDDIQVNSMIVEHRNVQDNSYTSYSNNSYLYSDYEVNGKKLKTYVFLEAIMTSLEPSVQSIGPNGEVEFSLEKRKYTELDFVRKMHQVIETFFTDFIQTMYVQNVEISPKIGDVIFSFKDLKFTDEKCSFFDQYNLMDDFGLGKFSVIRH